MAIGASLLWSLLSLIVIGGAIALFIWGGTNDAHERCLAHRFGESGFLGSAACVVEH